MFGKNSKKENPNSENPASNQAANDANATVNQAAQPGQNQTNQGQPNQSQTSQTQSNQVSDRSELNQAATNQATAQSESNQAGKEEAQANKIQAELEKSAADKKIEELTKKNAEYLSDLQRNRADFENFRKQVEVRIENAKSIATQKTIMDFLPLLDDITRAIDANPETLNPIRKTLDKTLSKLHLEKIDAKPGTEFDPEIHEALSIDENTEGDKDVISEELQAGYRYNGMMIREAKVRVKHSN